MGMWYITQIHRSYRIQTLQTIIIGRSQEALPVVGLPKHLTCLPEVPDRSTIIYGICWFEVLFWKGHNGFKSCVILRWTADSFIPRHREPLRKKNFYTTTPREWQNTTSDRHIKIIIGVSQIYSCCVRFVQRCTNNKLMQSLLELN